VSTRRFTRGKGRREGAADAPPDAELLEHDVLDALGGGRTMSQVELVTDLGVRYGEVAYALGRLLDSGLVEVAYEADDERFFALADAGVAALNEGGNLDLEQRPDEVAREPAT
jgi:hypothetical protein